MIESVWDNAIQKKTSSINYGNTLHHLDSFDTVFSEKNKFNSNKKYSSPPETDFGKQFSNMNIRDDDINTIKNYFFKRHSNKAMLLANNNISDKGFIDIAKFLKHDSVVKHLIFSNNQIHFSEFSKAALADLLKINRHIGWLVFNNNEIGDLGAKNLGEALSLNESVKHLVLSHNSISDDGLISLLNGIDSHPTIESIFIANNNLTSKSFNRILNYISNNTSIKRLDISGNKFTAKDLSVLRVVCHKRNVRLIS